MNAETIMQFANEAKESGRTFDMDYLDRSSRIHEVNVFFVCGDDIDGTQDAYAVHDSDTGECYGHGGTQRDALRSASFSLALIARK